MNEKKTERGQAAILLALAFIAILGFTALAIDGGMIYAHRRNAQSAADAASLAGGGAAALYLENHYMDNKDWDCSDPRVKKAQDHNSQGAKNAAIRSAAANDYSIDTDISDNNGVTTECIENKDNGSWTENYLDVITEITTDSPTTFAQFVFNGPLRLTVEAVTRVYPRRPLAFGNAIVSLAMTCDEGGIEFDGNNSVNVYGGGIFSNSCITRGGNAGVNVYGGYDISCVLPDCYTDNGGSGVINPFPEEGTGIPIPPSAVEVPTPDCTGLPSRGKYNKDGNLEPGIYSEIKIPNGNHTMEAGLYCVTNDFEINGGSITGSSVTFFIINGNFLTSGNATTRITAPRLRNCGAPCDTHRAIPGVLIYLAPGNTNLVTLRGTQDSEFLGLIYAPDGSIEAGGTGSTLGEIHAQLIGNNVKIYGNTSVEVNFDNQMNYQLPASLELNR